MTPFDDEIRAFIATHVASVEELETLLLMFNDPRRRWTAASVSAELRTSESSARTKLASLAQREFLIKEPDGYRMNPDCREKDLIEKLGVLYKERRVSVIAFIYQSPESDLKRFSDAFRLRPE